MTQRADGALCLNKEYLLPDNHKHLQKFLDRLKETKAKELENPDPTSTVWRAQIAHICYKSKILMSSVTATPDVYESEWCDALPLREQKGIHVHLACQGDKPITSLDTSQSITQMTAMKFFSFPTLCPRDRLLLRQPHVSKTRILVGVEKA